MIALNKGSHYKKFGVEVCIVVDDNQKIVNPYKIFNSTDDRKY